MAMQIRRTRGGGPPAGLLPGQLGVEMAAAPTPILSGEDTLHAQITVGFALAH